MQRAKDENKSISAWVREKLEESLARSWTEKFVSAHGALAGLEGFERPAQPAFKLDQPRDDFDE